MSLKPVLLPFGKTIYQSQLGQAVTTDHTYLIDLILSRTGNEELEVLDLGCGNGILAIMLAHNRPTWNLLGLEIQPHLVELARGNCKLVGLSNLEIFQEDFREWDVSSSFDIILSNPPYHPVNHGRLSPIKEKALSTHELNCNMLDILIFLKKYLKSTGEAYLIYPFTRAEEMEKYAKKVDLNIEAEFSFNKSNKKKVIFVLTKW